MVADSPSLAMYIFGGNECLRLENEEEGLVSVVARTP